MQRVGHIRGGGGVVMMMMMGPKQESSTLNEGRQAKCRDVGW